MIKGINKQVVEVGQTGNRYYEKAILFLRPEYADIQMDILEKEAKNFLKNVDTVSSVKKRNRRIKWILQLGSAAVAGAVLCTVVLNYLWH